MRRTNIAHMVKYAIVALTDPSEHARIYHAFLYFFDFVENGIDAELFLDGESVKIIDEMEKNPNDIIKPLYDRAVKEGRIKQACNFCAGAFGVKGKIVNANIALSKEESHINVSGLVKDGYQILSLAMTRDQYFCTVLFARHSDTCIKLDVPAHRNFQFWN